MGHYPLGQQSAGSLALLLGLLYLLVLFVLIWSLFGLVRTIATRLPIPPSDGLTLGLYPFDVIGVKLYSFSSPGRKWLKIAQLSGWFALSLGGWWAVLYASHEGNLPWFGWGLNVSPWWVASGHVVLVAIIAAPFVRRAITHANKYPRLRAVS